MDGVGTPIIGRPRPLPRHDTPNPAYHPHTLNYEEPHMAFWLEEYSNTLANEKQLALSDSAISEVLRLR